MALDITDNLVSYFCSQHPQYDRTTIVLALQSIAPRVTESLTFSELADIYGLLLSKYQLIQLLPKKEHSSRLPRIPSPRRSINTLELMHEDESIIRIDYTQKTVSIINEAKLPFSLYNQEIDILAVERWVDRRISSLHRTYMSKVYLLRKIGRDLQKIISDSSAISVIDNFWIRRPDTRQNWNEILAIKDMNRDLIEVALDGNLRADVMKKAYNDVTSIFTLKGAFPKVPYAQTLMKKGCNAEYEVAGYRIGTALGVSVAFAEDLKDGIIACHLFTSVNRSMFHIDDILSDTLYDGNNLYEAVYEYYSLIGRNDIVLQLERLYILAYITINIDMHQENFGIMYDPKDFSLLGVAPAYDFNDAFQPWEDVHQFDPWIVANLPVFLSHNPDIIVNVPRAIQAVNNCEYLSDESKKCVVQRLEYLLML